MGADVLFPSQFIGGLFDAAVKVTSRNLAGGFVNKEPI